MRTARTRAVRLLFGPRYGEGPKRSDLPSFTTTDAVLICWVGDLNRMNGEWPVLGRLPNFQRTTWTMPPFVRQEPLSGRRFQATYADDDPNKLMREVELRKNAEAEPRDFVAGAGAVEIMVTKLLSFR
jgi:hypothetical protein